MKTWNVSGGVWASTYVGEIEAETGEEAIKIAYARAHVGVCHECAECISDPEISHLTAECGDEVVSDEDTGTSDRILELEAEIERMRPVVGLLRRGKQLMVCSRDRGYMAPHRKCRGCESCKWAQSTKETLATLDNHPGLKDGE